MLGDSLWPQSTGAGLGNLAQNGRQKVKAIEQAKQQDTFEREVKALPDYKPAGEETTIPSLSILAQINPLTPRTQEEQNAVTGLTMFPKSTGAATAPLAQQVLAREKAEKQNALYRMQAKERAESLRQRRAARHGKDRTSAHAFRSEFEQDIKNGMVELPFKRPKPFRSNQSDTNRDLLSPQQQRQQWLKNQQDRNNHESNKWPHQPGKLNNSSEAVDYYFDENAPIGPDGIKQPADLSDKVKNGIIFNDAAIAQYERLKRGTAQDPPGVAINLENKWDTFHVGDTTIQYKEVCKEGICTATFVAPQNKQGSKNIPDRFQDPTNFGFELPGGTPYDYETFEWKFSYPDPHKK